MRNKEIIDSHGIPVLEIDDHTTNSLILELQGLRGEYRRVSHSKEKLFWLNADISGNSDNMYSHLLINGANTIRELITDPNLMIESQPTVMKIVKVYPKHQTYDVLNCYETFDVKIE